MWEYTRRFDVPYSPLYDIAWIDAQGISHKIPRNGCMACGTDLLYANNHMAALRRTHPRAWEVFMRKGMAEEIRKLQQEKRNGQVSLLDIMGTDELMERRPCIFDRVDRLVMDELTTDEEITDYDPDDYMGELLEDAV